MLGWTNLIFGEILVPEKWAKMLLANEIAGFFKSTITPEPNFEKS